MGDAALRSDLDSLLALAVDVVREASGEEVRL